ncbi:MAG: PQQ-binding-like beta-propeller repeat protein [Myxococcota bacterium]
MHRGRIIPPQPDRPALQRLARLLLHEWAGSIELPATADLTAAVTSLATGLRHKALLPLGTRPVEFALVRHGAQVRVSCYETGGAPRLYVWNAPVDVRTLLEASAKAAMESARFDEDPSARRLAVRLAERALRTVPEEDVHGGTPPVVREGGAVQASSQPLSFGFTATIQPGIAPAVDRSTRADLHALLFDGSLWAHVRGRRIALARGPIMLVVQRMVDAVRALVDAWEAGRAANVRLRSGGFRIGVRLDRQAEVTLTLGTADGDEVTATSLDVPEVALPILRVASDLVRSLVSVDRGQSRNLRVRTLRDEVRALRRAARARSRAAGFVNHDPDRLRTATPPTPGATDTGHASPPPRSAAGASLRFTERWRFELEGLDATSTFLCGNRLVIATARHTVALCRDRGDVLWARDGGDTTAWMAGPTLLRVAADGGVELCDVEDGEPYAHSRIAPRTGGSLRAWTVSGNNLPPMAIVSEGPRRLVAIDLRTGELRWRFASHGEGPMAVRQAGRVLLVGCGEGAISAIDLATGEVAWRFGDHFRVAHRPAVCGEVVVAAAGGPGAAAGALYGLDLYRGSLRWSRELPAGPAADPIATPRHAVVPLDDALHAIDPTDGSVAWTTAQGTGGRHGASLTVDDQLVLNSPAGGVTALDLEDGTPRWTRSLSHPVADDVPRRLEPILRAGALFVPSARVHVLRPSDGAPLGEPLPCDLVPDLLQVDERGWVYVLEESGQLAALAPAPKLRLIRGGV